MPVKIFIDSGSDITENEAKQLGLGFLPIEVRFGEEEYLDGVNLTAETFYDKLATSKEFPKTSQINPFRFEECFAKETLDGSEVVIIPLSSQISGTYRSALEGAKNFEGKVFVVDGKSAVAGQRLLAYHALELANQGLSGKEIKEKLELVKDKLYATAVVDTLEYLKKGGRISATSAMIGSMLSIKPIIAIVNGEVKVIAKAVGTKKSYSTMMSLSEKFGEIDYSMPLCLLYAGNDTTNLENFKKTIPNIIQNNGGDIKAYKIGSTIGAHIGPGAVGIVFFKK